MLGTMAYEMHGKRLRAAGYTTPVPITYFHGWNSEPSTEIAADVKKSGLFRVHEVQLKGTTVWAMYRTRHGVYAFLVVLAYLYFLYHNFILVLAFPIVHCGFKHFERKTVFGVVDKDVDAAVESFRSDPPSLVVGYHYGGGLATWLLQHRLWKGPTVLLRPFGGMVCTSMGNDPPTLAGLTSPELESCEHDRSSGAGADSSLPPVLIVHGAADSKVPASESYLLAASHAGDNCRLLLSAGDDDRLLTLCRGELFTGMLVDLLCGMVGTMADPVSGKPSRAGLLKERAVEAGEQPPFVELTGAHLAMATYCNAAQLET